ncbi:MAG: endonuclease/exonuclease/phosphatase family protein [Deltaproteobacteria bacterium]|nr:endonuclease/exonuclease/phosphatase family protein [Deltaproteobacteria bacterium]
MNSLTFTCLTFNTMGAPLKPAVAARYKRIGPWLVRFARERGVDFITLQETYRTALRDNHLIRPWACEFKHFMAVNDRGGRLFQGGLCTLSRHEITGSSYRIFSQGKLLDSLVAKGILLTRIKLPQGCEIDVYNIHTQSSDLSQKFRFAVRTHQFLEALHFIKQTHNPNNTVLLTGDLNIEEYNDEYPMLVEKSGALHPYELKFFDVMRGVFPDKTRYPLKTYKSIHSGNEYKLDHVLLRPAKGGAWDRANSTTEIIDTGLSDHRAVLSQICVRC